MILLEEHNIYLCIVFRYILKFGCSSIKLYLYTTRRTSELAGSEKYLIFEHFVSREIKFVYDVSRPV